MARITVSTQAGSHDQAAGWLTGLPLVFGSEKPHRTSRRELAFLLGNLATLVENGLSLRKSLATLASDQSLKKHARLLDAIRRKIDAGESFSAALAAFPSAFSELVVNQVRVGERSGTIAATLWRIVDQLEQRDEFRAKIVKRLSYPLLVFSAGILVVIFLLSYVVPQFEATYHKARVPLPFITRFLMTTGNLAATYGWIVLLAIVVAAIALYRGRRNPAFAYHTDRLLLRTPLLGTWLRDLAVLQFVEVLGVMMQSGFKLVDALTVSSGSIGNRVVRSAVEDLRAAVVRGERLSRELDRYHDLFPPIVSQLVIVGEQTGNLAKSAEDVRHYLRRQVDRKSEMLAAALEPILTIAMATTVGVILLAIYMPMFNMIDAVDTVRPK